MIGSLVQKRTYGRAYFKSEAAASRFLWSIAKMDGYRGEKLHIVAIRNKPVNGYMVRWRSF